LVGRHRAAIRAEPASALTPQTQSVPGRVAIVTQRLRAAYAAKWLAGIAADICGGFRNIPYGPSTEADLAGRDWTWCARTPASPGSRPGSGGPGLVVAEDMQWFDASTIEVLGSLLATDGGRVLIA